MSRTFTDANLLTWEAYASGGKFGLPEQPKIVFLCLSDPDSRARYIRFSEGDEADAEQAVSQMDDQRLRELLATASELD